MTRSSDESVGVKPARVVRWPARSVVVPLAPVRSATVTPIRPGLVEECVWQWLLDLAARVAAATSPDLPLELAGEERLLLAMILPHLTDDQARERFAEIVTELHQEAASEGIDRREAEYVFPQDHRDCAVNLARAAVAADIAAAGGGE
jgi:hypothetical protein